MLKFGDVRVFRARSARAVVAGSLVVLFALVLAACGSSSTSSSSSTSASSSSASTPAPSAGSGSGATISSAYTPDTSAAQKLGLEYTGGKAGAASSSSTPFVIGYINQQGAAPSFEEGTNAMKAAVSFVNEYLGGAQGHAIQLKTCFIVSSPADAQACAQKMAADSSVNLVVLGDAIVGTASIYATLLGRKPFWSITANTGADLSEPTPFFFSGQGGNALSVLYAKQDLKAKSVAIVPESNPGAVGAAQQLAINAKKVGMGATVSVAQTSSDFNSALLSSGAASAGAVMAAVSVGDCAPMTQALKQSGITTPVISFQFCAEEAVAKSNGGDLPHWSFFYNARNPLDPASSPQVAAYRTMMAKYQPKSAYSDPVPFGSTMIIAKMLNQIGVSGLTPSKVTTWQKAFKGPVFLGSPTAACGTASKKFPSLCVIWGTIGRYQGAGKWETTEISES